MGPSLEWSLEKGSQSYESVETVDLLSLFPRSPFLFIRKIGCVTLPDLEQEFLLGVRRGIWTIYFSFRYHPISDVPSKSSANSKTNYMAVSWSGNESSAINLVFRSFTSSSFEYAAQKKFKREFAHLRTYIFGTSMQPNQPWIDAIYARCPWVQIFISLEHIIARQWILNFRDERSRKEIARRTGKRHRSSFRERLAKTEMSIIFRDFRTQSIRSSSLFPFPIIFLPFFYLLTSEYANVRSFLRIYGRKHPFLAIYEW